MVFRKWMALSKGRRRIAAESEVHPSGSNQRCWCLDLLTVTSCQKPAKKSFFRRQTKPLNGCVSVLWWNLHIHRSVVPKLAGIWIDSLSPSYRMCAIDNLRRVSRSRFVPRSHMTVVVLPASCHQDRNQRRYDSTVEPQPRNTRVSDRFTAGTASSAGIDVANVMVVTVGFLRSFKEIWSLSRCLEYLRPSPILLKLTQSTRVAVPLRLQNSPRCPRGGHPVAFWNLLGHQPG